MESKPTWPDFKADDSELDVLVKLSQYYGLQEQMVLGGGGNTSVKIGNRLFVKGSGTTLSTIEAEGFVELDRDTLEKVLLGPPCADQLTREKHFKRAVLAARIHPDKGQRPSVESVLHHLMPGKYVLHIHPTLVNVLSCSTGGQQMCRKLFGDDVAWVPFVDPGLILAQTVNAAMLDSAVKPPRAVIMQNHGLIVCGNEVETIRDDCEFVVETIRKHLEVNPIDGVFGQVKLIEPDKAVKLLNVMGPALRGLLSQDDALKVVTFDDSQEVLNFAGSADAESLTDLGPLTPDHITYCKSFPMWFDAGGYLDAEMLVKRLGKAIAAYEKKWQYGPIMVAVKGLGVFAAGDDATAANTARVLFRDSIAVIAGAVRIGGVHPMTEDQWRFIEGTEFEAYRRGVAAAERPKGRAAGKIAVVTGAAQGFGLEISQDFAAQGGHVVLADVNAEGAANAAEAINARIGQDRAIGLAINVTDGDSVAEAMCKVVRRFGGFDVLISNAGVLRAESVKTQSAGDFEFVTAVNYKGYFLCVQKASPILAVQHKARCDYWSDIVQINSKSGLEGSNKNGAYAGSKFGGIGLTQSFAMELVEDGIKVNSICPGNFLDGPLWSDPKNGLFVKYLEAGKVPGAKTVADVRKAYEARVPMNRGCTTADVMKAVYYVMEQKYETGQAIPVTGGQVMLK